MRTLLWLSLATIALTGCGKDEGRPAERTAAPGAAPLGAPASAPAPAPASASGTAAVASRAPTVAPSGSTYTVAKGDTLSGIARTHGLSVADLARWNDIQDPRRLRVGQQLRLTAP